MAEVVLRERFDAAGIGHAVEVTSTGISDEERGNPIDVRARKVLAAHGYDVPDRSAHQVTADDLVDQNLVLPMTAAHARALRRLAPEDGQGAEVVMYRSFDPASPQGGPEHSLDIADPWYGDDDGFEETIAQVEAAADQIVARVRGLLR